MEIWPIDFDKSLEEIAEWHKQWKAERYGKDGCPFDVCRFELCKQIVHEYGKDSLNPSRYYNDDGRYLYGVREGESLNDEKAESDRVLEILCRLRLINQRLKGVSLSQHLQWQERDQIKTERETLYREFLDIVQNGGQNLNQEPINKPKGRPKKTFLDCINGNDEEKENRLKRLHSLIDGRIGKDVCLYILVAINIGWITKPTFKQVKDEFGDIGARQGFSSYLNKDKFTDGEKEGALKALNKPF